MQYAKPCSTLPESLSIRRLLQRFTFITSIPAAVIFVGCISLIAQVGSIPNPTLKGTRIADVDAQWHGKLLRDPNTHAIYAIQRGKRRHIPDPTTLFMLGYDIGVEKNDLAVRSFDDGPPFPKVTSRLLGDERSRRIFLLVRGEAKWVQNVTSIYSLGFGNKEEQTMQDVSAHFPISSVPIPLLNKRLVHGTTPGGSIYLLDLGRRRKVPDPDTIIGMGFPPAQEQKLTDSELSTFPLGSDVPAIPRPKPPEPVPADRKCSIPDRKYGCFFGIYVGGTDWGCQVQCSEGYRAVCRENQCLSDRWVKSSCNCILK